PPTVSHTVAFSNGTRVRAFGTPAIATRKDTCIAKRLDRRASRSKYIRSERMKFMSAAFFLSGFVAVRYPLQKRWMTFSNVSQIGRGGVNTRERARTGNAP